MAPRPLRYSQWGRRLPEQLGTGMILRISRSGAVQTIATGLSFPTAMTFGPDGALYVSNLGFAGPGAGQIVRVPVSPK
jgi:hypothetical protein